MVENGGGRSIIVVEGGEVVCVVVESPEDRNKIKAEQTRRTAQEPPWGRVNFNYSILR
jgi:hypothetical protein